MSNLSTLADGPGLVKQIAETKDIVSELRRFEELKGKLLDRDDIQIISDKNFTKKSGWRKLALAFGISTEIMRQEIKTLEDGSFIWLFTVRATAPNGRHTECVASCHSKERNFSHLQHDVFATAQTRATNRAISDLIGCGEISAEEVAPDETRQPAPLRNITPAKPEELRPFIYAFADPIPVEFAEDLKKELDRIMTQFPPSKYAIRPGKDASELASVFMKDVPSDAMNMVKNQLAEAERKLIGGE